MDQTGLSIPRVDERRGPLSISPCRSVLDAAECGFRTGRKAGLGPRTAAGLVSFRLIGYQHSRAIAEPDGKGGSTRRVHSSLAAFSSQTNSLEPATCADLRIVLPGARSEMWKVVAADEL